MMKGQEPRSSSSCAACKLLKRRCIPNCVFAPHFRSDEPRKFVKVHKVFGASNVSKILNEVPEEQREDTVNSLVYEAEARLRDPVYGCIGAIAMLQSKMAELQHDLTIARARLAQYALKPASFFVDDPHNNISINNNFNNHSSILVAPFNDLQFSHGYGLVDNFNHNPFEIDQLGSSSSSSSFSYDFTRLSYP